ncbi:hypothetical protein B296_00034854 [Ensete ventricosum]|uniref:Uncharacterized protein n=1 Tax=Ensete ventricosum TaxID=4639 RepID=A0A426X2N7_ENSVE|nr:hypothetical protein B296_00034854 [Ensete ventricosum]
MQRGGGSASHCQPPYRLGRYSQGPPYKGRSVAAKPLARVGHPQGQQPVSGRSPTGATLAGRLPAGRSIARCQRPARIGATPTEAPLVGTTSVEGAFADEQG